MGHIKRTGEMVAESSNPELSSRWDEINGKIREAGIDAYVSRFYSDEHYAAIMVKRGSGADKKVKDIMAGFGYEYYTTALDNPEYNMMTFTPGKPVTEGARPENGVEALKGIMDDYSVSVLIRKTEGDTGNKAGDIIDSLGDFIDWCKNKTSECGGTIEVTTQGGLEYNAYIEDAEGNMTASVDFMLVYFSEDTKAFVDLMFQPE